MRTPISKNKCLTGAAYGKELIELFSQVERTIEIVMFDWRWYELDPANPMQLINNALVQAARRGVNVRCVTSSPDVILTLNGCGLKAKKVQRRGLLHSKMVILDSEVVLIGSHNFTHNALAKNYETTMLIADAESAEAWRAIFEKLWLS